MRVRWNMQEADFVLAKDMATERLSANTKTTVVFSMLKVVICVACAAAVLALIEAFRFGPGAGSTLVLAVSAVTAIAAFAAASTPGRRPRNGPSFEHQARSQFHINSRSVKRASGLRGRTRTRIFAGVA
jgi:hypothetical protein